MAVQNKENLAMVQKLMEQSDEINLGTLKREQVPIDYTSTSGYVYKGLVEFKRPSVKDYMRMGAIKSEILREAGVINIELVDSTIKFMAHVLATLQVCMVKCPEWLLNLEAITDTDLLYEVYEKYEVWQDSFRKDIKQKSEGDSQATQTT